MRCDTLRCSVPACRPLQLAVCLNWCVLLMSVRQRQLASW
jgi:hypothetical protein